MTSLLIVILAFSLYITTASGQSYYAAAAASACDCQCSSYTYSNKWGNVQGNCKSTYRGKQWCYVDSSNQNCQDLEKGPDTGKLWSFQACSTPALSSPECSYTANIPTIRWSTWSACSRPCGGGTRTRSRRYNTQSRDCNTQSCHNGRSTPDDDFCFCINPFFGTGTSYIGDPETTCRENSWCYVDRNADCRDVRPAAGRGRWYSYLACGVRNGLVAATNFFE